MAVKKVEGDVSTEKKRWEEDTLKKYLKKAPERMERFTTVSDAEIDRLYGPWDVEGQDYMRDLGLPGEYPFTPLDDAAVRRLFDRKGYKPPL
jgi:methylmalonyl-CoA mutase N-terminal domain/subunit